MNCREFVEFMIDYLDGTLDSDQLAVFEQHIVACPPCVEYLESYKISIRIGRTACQCADDQLPPEVPEHLVRAILAARKGPK